MGGLQCRGVAGRAWQVVVSPLKGSSTTALFWRRAECSPGGGAHELTHKAADADPKVILQEIIYSAFVFVGNLSYRRLRRAGMSTHNVSPASRGESSKPAITYH